MGVVENEEKPNEAIASAKIINYQSIEDAELYTTDNDLAKNACLPTYICDQLLSQRM